jgi:hypothetical protein
VLGPFVQHLWDRSASVHTEPTFESHRWSTQVSPVHLTLRSKHSEREARQWQRGWFCQWAMWTLGHNVRTPHDIARARPAVPRLLPVTSKKSQWCRAAAMPAAFRVYKFSESVCTRLQTRRRRTRQYSSELYPVWQNFSRSQGLEGFIWLAISGEPPCATHEGGWILNTCCRSDGAKLMNNGRWREFVTGRGVQLSSKNGRKECFFSHLTGMRSGRQESRCHWKDI